MMFNLLIAKTQDITNPILPEMYNTGELDVFSSFIVSLVTLAFLIATLAFMFLVVWGAIQWIMSGGDKGAVQAAQSKITNAIIGLVVLFATYAILAILGYFFKIEALQLPFVLELEDIILN